MTRGGRSAAPRRLVVVSCLVVAMLAALLPAASAAPRGGGSRQPTKDPVAEGRGGAVSTVDPVATEAGLEVLRKGGNAVDAAVAAAATLGVTEPYSSGIGGGGFMLVREAGSGEVVVIEGREETPDDHRFGIDVFAGGAEGFFDAVNSGPSLGRPARWTPGSRRSTSTGRSRSPRR